MSELSSKNNSISSVRRRFCPTMSASLPYKSIHAIKRSAYAISSLEAVSAPSTRTLLMNGTATENKCMVMNTVNREVIRGRSSAVLLSGLFRAQQSCFPCVKDRWSTTAAAPMIILDWLFSTVLHGFPMPIRESP